MRQVCFSVKNKPFPNFGPKGLHELGWEEILQDKGCSPDIIFLTGIMIKDIEKVKLKTFKSVYQDNSNNYSNIDNFRVTGFRSEKPNTKSLVELQFTSKNTSTGTLFERM